MGSVAFTVEGILRRPVGGQPVPAGIDLYYGMATRSKIVLLTDSPEDRDTTTGMTSLEWWLRLEGLSAHSQIIYADKVMQHEEPASAREMQLSHARGSGHDITLVFEPDPQVASWLITRGYTTLLFAHAQYAVPSWRPDYEHRPRPWDDLQHQMAYEAYLKASDPRREEA